jgi:hypothetical protein
MDNDIMIDTSKKLTFYIRKMCENVYFFAFAFKVFKKCYSIMTQKKFFPEKYHSGFQKIQK